MLSRKRVKATVLTAALVLGISGTAIGHAYAADADPVALTITAPSVKYDVSSPLTDEQNAQCLPENAVCVAEEKSVDAYAMDADFIADVASYPCEACYPEDMGKVEYTVTSVPQTAERERSKEEKSSAPKPDKVSEIVEEHSTVNSIQHLRGEGRNIHSMVAEKIHDQEYRGGIKANVQYAASDCGNTDTARGNAKMQKNFKRYIPEFRKNYFRTISLAAGSYASGKINISTTATSRYQSAAIGIRSIRLERYQNKRWMTIRAWTNSYHTNTDRYSFSTTADNLQSGEMYRVVATYTLRNNAVSSTVIRTSAPLMCK